MDVIARFEAPCPADRLYAEVCDLASYPEWLSIVSRAVPDPDEPDVWQIDLRGRLGPLSRSKRLRMVRTDQVDGVSVRFERRELDGRDHSAWVLEAVVAPASAGSELEMHLHYGGGFGGAILERMLNDEIDRSRPRLQERLAAR